MKQSSFLAFLSEYYGEQKAVSKDVPDTYTDFLNEVSVEELLEIAELYGTSRYSAGACSWKLAFPDTTINDIPVLKSLSNR